MKRILAVSLCMCLFSSVVWADTFGTGDNQFEIDFVNISAATNPASGIPAGDNFTFTGVTKDYRMGTYEITNDQWTKFKAAYGAVAGTPSNGYDQDSAWAGSSVPTNNVSWYEAAQFVNWLNTSSGKSAAYKFTGTQGTGDYTLGVWSSQDADGTNLYRNKNAKYFLPTEDEWVKAAYWNGTSLQAYSNASAGDLYQGLPDPWKWNNQYSVDAQPWAVGSGCKELNDTYDMMGNVSEWMESPYATGDYRPGVFRGVRGGSYEVVGVRLISSYRSAGGPNDEANHSGFRVASVVPLCVNKPSMDVNGDCKVDFLDFTEFASQWLTSGFDIQDFTVFASQWLTCGLDI